jgi:signal transduction histidine kinase
LRKFVSDRRAPLRDGLFSYTQLAMLGGIVIVLLTSIGSTAASDTANILELGALTLVVSVLAALLPWHRIARIWLLAVALFDVFVVASLRTELVATQPTLIILVLIPALWLSYSFGLLGVIVAAVCDYFVALFPNWLSGQWPSTPAAWGVATLIPAIVSGVGIAVYIAARQLQRQRDQLARAHDELQAAVGARDEFLRTISHELRTPLTSMIGYLEVIEDSVDLEQSGIAEPFAVIQRNSQRLLSLITSLITEAWGRPAPTRRPESVAELASKALDAARPAAAIAGVSISSTGLDSVSAELDASDISEVFDEVLSNAIKFSRRGGSVFVNVARDDNEVVVRIEDSGIGIPVDDLPRVFERFFRGSTVGGSAIAGTGLGLSAVKTIVQSHAGTIRATSVHPHGTMMEIRLPLVVPRAPQGRPA